MATASHCVPAGKRQRCRDRDKAPSRKTKLGEGSTRKFPTWMLKEAVFRVERSKAEPETGLRAAGSVLQAGQLLPAREAGRKAVL